jgi:RHS repeat-associated protein
MESNSMRVRKVVRCVAGIALLALASVKAMAEDPVPLDAATMAALGIVNEPATATASGRPPVAPNVGPWSWSSGTYQYDGSGNITAIGSQAFAYDTQGRLIAAKLTRPDVSGSIGHTYTYDDVGNMIARTESGSNPIQMTTSVATNHLTGLSVTYDAAGNVTQLQPPGQAYIYQYTYDALGSMQMAKVSNVSDETRQIHVYTASDERIWTYDLGEEKSHWTIRDLGGNVLRDFEDDGTTWTVSRDYIYRDGLLLAAVTPTNTLHYSLDHLGTPRVISDENRHRVGFHHYFPFGLEWLDNSGAQEEERKKFTGHERDRDPAGGLNGVDYMHARYYAPSMSRFLSVDPELNVEGTIAQPQKWNRYSYVLDNPMKYTDPNGREENLVGGGTIVNSSSQTVYIAFDGQMGTRSTDYVIPLKPGESSERFTFDADAVVVAPGQNISGATNGSFKVSAGSVEITDGKKGGLVLAGSAVYRGMKGRSAPEARSGYQSATQTPPQWRLTPERKGAGEKQRQQAASTLENRREQKTSERWEKIKDKLIFWR